MNKELEKFLKSVDTFQNISKKMLYYESFEGKKKLIVYSVKTVRNIVEIVIKDREVLKVIKNFNGYIVKTEKLKVSKRESSYRKIVGTIL